MTSHLALKQSLTDAPIIDAQLVESIYQEEVLRATGIIPLRMWAVKPVRCEVSELPIRVMGTCNNNGVIKISESYFFTSCTDNLRSTMRHEFSHMVLGLNINHVEKFWDLNDRLGGKRFHQNTPEFIAEVGKRKGYKYELYAVLLDKSMLLVGGAARKSKAKTEYIFDPATLSRYTTNDGQIINRFEYIEIK